MKRVIILAIIATILFGAVGTSQAAAVFDISKVKQVLMNVYYNGAPVSLTDPNNSGNYQFLIYNNRTYVPLRLIAETMGADRETMWSSTAPNNINLNTTTPAGFVTQQEYNSLKIQSDTLKASAASAEKTIADLKAEKATLLAENDTLRTTNSQLTQNVSTGNANFKEMQRQYNVIVNTDNVAYPYFRSNVPSSFNVDRSSFLQYYDWDTAAARTQIMLSDVVTNMLKKYCEATSIGISQSDGGVVYLSGVNNATRLRNVKEIQDVVNQTGIAITFELPSTWFPNDYIYYPVK